MGSNPIVSTNLIRRRCLLDDAFAARLQFGMRREHSAVPLVDRQPRGFDLLYSASD